MNDFIEFVTWPTHQNLFHNIRTQALVFYVKGEQNAAIGLTAKFGPQCHYWCNSFVSTMHDFIEFVTWPTHQNLFHNIRTQALVFYVKGEQNAAIGLTAKSGTQCHYWIILGQNTCAIIEDDEQVCKANTPDILSVREYRRFWISWYGNVLKFGQDKNPKAILSTKITKREMNYVTFSVVGETNELYWKCLIPSPIINLPLAKFNEGKAYWVKADNQLPDDAVIGGFENEILYIVRSHHRSSLTPGKFVPSEGIGYISWGEASHPKAGEDLEILCGYNMIWKKANGNIIPTGSVKGGYSEVNHEILYVGRAQHNGHVIPGKVQPSHNVCYFSYGDREEAKTDYEILVYPHPCPSASNHYVSNLYDSYFHDHYSSESDIEGF